MAKSNFITVILVLFAIEGAFLIIYGFVMGASFWAIVDAFMRSNAPTTSVKEMYVIIGIGRLVLAFFEMKEIKTRAGMIVIGILFVYCSTGGVTYCIAIGGINASNVYGIAIEFIVTFTLSLYYLIYALKLPRLRLNLIAEGREIYNWFTYADDFGFITLEEKYNKKRVAGIEKAVFDGAVYLIGNTVWGPDPVYKVTARGDTLYFCYADNKACAIDLDIAENVNLTEEGLLNHKKSFSLPIADITRVEINTKRSERICGVHNNGTAFIHTSGHNPRETIAERFMGTRKLDLIIHAVNDHAMIEEFFKNIAPVTVEIDKHDRLAISKSRRE